MTQNELLILFSVLGASTLWLVAAGRGWTRGRSRDFTGISLIAGFFGFLSMFVWTATVATAGQAWPFAITLISLAIMIVTVGYYLSQRPRPRR